MKASSLTLNLAFDLVFPLMTHIIHILPIKLNQDNRRTKDELMSRKLTLPLPSPLVPTPFTKGEDRPDPHAISKTIAPMNFKFCRVL